MRFHQDRHMFTSGKIAKARTELTIAADRLDCSQEEMARLQDDVITLLSKYMRLDRGLFEIRIDIITRVKRGVQDVKTIQIK